MDIYRHKRIFFNTAVADVFRAIDGGALVGAFILNFCLIDQLAWIDEGDQRYAFNRFVQKWLTGVNPSYKDLDEELYSVRNGLVHSYGPSKKILDQKFSPYELYHGDPGSHLQRINNHRLKLCLYCLSTELVLSAHNFFAYLSQCANLGQLERLKNQIQVVRIEPPINFSNMHIVLSALDNPEKLDLNSIKADYSKYILWK